MSCSAIIDGMLRPSSCFYDDRNSRLCGGERRERGSRAARLLDGYAEVEGGWRWAYGWTVPASVLALVGAQSLPPSARWHEPVGALPSGPHERRVRRAQVAELLQEELNGHDQTVQFNDFEAFRTRCTNPSVPRASEGGATFLESVGEFVPPPVETALVAVAPRLLVLLDGAARNARRRARAGARGGDPEGGVRGPPSGDAGTKVPHP